MTALASKRKKKKSLFVRIVVWGVVLVVGLLMAAVGLGYWWINQYVQSDAFRQMLSRKIGQATGTYAELSDLNVIGPFVRVSSAKLYPKKEVGWVLIEGDHLEADVGLDRLRQGVIDVKKLSLDRATLHMRGKEDSLGELPVHLDHDVEPTELPAWLKRWAPQRTDIAGVEIESFNLDSPDAGGLKITDLRLSGKPTDANDDLWQLRGESGLLKLPGVKEPFRFDSATAQLDKSGLVLHDGAGRWIGDSEVTARGDLPFGDEKDWKFTGSYRALDMRPFMEEAVRQHFSGFLNGTYEVVPDVFSTHVEAKDAVIQNLPLLDRVADFTRTAQFRRLVLHEAKADIKRAGERIEIRNLVLQSNDLIRMEGSVDLHGRRLAGDLLVGVTTATLRWIPGSQSRVFTEERQGYPGLVWTRVRLSGTLDSPKEDLSNRLLAAMGKALILDAPLGAAGAGVDLLMETPGVAGEAAKGTVETGKDVLEGAGKAAEKAVESGADLLKKVIPVFGN